MGTHLEIVTGLFFSLDSWSDCWLGPGVKFHFPHNDLCVSLICFIQDAFFRPFNDSVENADALVVVVSRTHASSEFDFECLTDHSSEPIQIFLMTQHSKIISMYHNSDVLVFHKERAWRGFASFEPN